VTCPLRPLVLLAALGLSWPAAAQSPIANDPFQSVPAPQFRPRPTPAPAPSPPPAPRPVASGYPAPVGQGFRDCGDCPELVVIPAGTFEMGSPASEQERRDNEGPQRTVRLAAPLAVGRHPVTVGQYRAFVAATGRSDGGSCWVWTAAGKWEEEAGRNWRNPGFPQTDAHPVVCVSWEDAQAYVRWLSGRGGQQYRLLTEAEWEYAARAGTRTRWWWGEDEGQQCQHANGADATARVQVPGASGRTVAPCDDGVAYTSAVGRYRANRFGLHDMGGNVFQWVEDCFVDSYAGAPSDASVAVTSGGCSARVLRGGSWGNDPRNLRAAFRVRLTPGNRLISLGFRVARTPGG
jgi:formylglycine-generating enzyme required for sulfatase activity